MGGMDTAPLTLATPSSDPGEDLARVAEDAALAALRGGEHVQQADVSLSRSSAAAAWQVAREAQAAAAAKSGVRPLMRRFSFGGLS